MPNIIDANGLQTATRAELLDYFTAQYQAIYGADINLASDTPDGQMLNINIQTILDLQDLLVQIYNMFDPDNAIGKVLDQRVAINGVQRLAGTYTVTPITIVNSQSVNLYGLDQDEQEVYTVSDNAGNLWQLQETQLGVGAGTHSYDFQAAVPGAQLTIPNTITVPITIVLGVTSVNNPTTYTTLGINEESDATLKVRRQRSVSLASQGYRAGLLAALENINGVSSAFVYENLTDVTDADGVPSHSIWVIVAGTGADADIAQAIYTKRNAGCGMFGQQSYIVTQLDGSPFEVLWDEVVTRNVFIQFNADPIDGDVSPNYEAIRDGLPAIVVPGVFDDININQIATAVQEIDDNTLVTYTGYAVGGISDGSLQELNADGIPASGTFKLSYNGNDSAAINWNDAIGTVQTKVRAIPGLSAANVTGTITAIDIDLSALDDVEAVVIVKDNTLQTAGLASVNYSHDLNFESILYPATKQGQFIVSTPNIIILRPLLTPANSAVGVGDTVQFTGLGGYGDYTFAIPINNSGATINASTGLYTAGATPGSDTISMKDALGYAAEVAVVVVT